MATASFPAMGTWIEISPGCARRSLLQSFPAMGTWIEIVYKFTDTTGLSVVPCNGNVD